MKNKIRMFIQYMYVFLCFFTWVGIVGNIELGVKTPCSCWILCLITTVLTIGKYIYCIGYKQQTYIFEVRS